MVGAGARLVSEGFAAVAVSHEKAAVGEAEQVGGQAPDSGGAVGDPRAVGRGPGSAAVGGVGLEGFVFVGFVFVADVGDEAAVGAFDGVEFVVVVGAIGGTDGEGGEELPGEAVVVGFPEAGSTFAGPEFLAGVEEAAVAEGDGAVGAVGFAGVPRRPGDTAVGGADHPLTEFALAEVGGETAVNGLPAGEFGGRPRAGAFGVGESGFVGE